MAKEHCDHKPNTEPLAGRVPRPVILDKNDSLQYVLTLQWMNFRVKFSNLCLTWEKCPRAMYLLDKFTVQHIHSRIIFFRLNIKKSKKWKGDRNNTWPTSRPIKEEKENQSLHDARLFLLDCWIMWSCKGVRDKVYNVSYKVQVKGHLIMVCLKLHGVSWCTYKECNSTHKVQYHSICSINLISDKRNKKTNQILGLDLFGVYEHGWKQRVGPAAQAQQHPTFQCKIILALCSLEPGRRKSHGQRIESPMYQ